MDRTSTFWTRQERLLAPLLAWGIGSVVVGCGLATSRRPAQRAFGMQALTWGAIDAALAVNGRRGARRSAAQHGENRDEQRRAAQTFGRIVAVNAGLDVLYLLGGSLMWQRSHTASTRGHGAGITMQGAFLLVYDLWLVQGVLSWMRV
jgi:hypothetical protein